MSPDEQRLFRMYGKLPNKKDLLQNKLKVRIFPLRTAIDTKSSQERKYFDSGDYALSKAGKASTDGVTQIGREHPNPENIPHSASPHNGDHRMSFSGGFPPGVATGGQSGSPVKESSFLQRGESIDDQPGEGGLTEEEREKLKSESGEKDASAIEASSVSPPLPKEGVPIRGPRS